ncbi:MAG: DUF354 domain-containing protein [Paludibacteraceae bacterium]|nr:DUF354 domain-containing protein [Paludibacteraceae bacterium]
MNILIQLSHPAHFHLYKNVAHNLIRDGHKVFILIKTKDILEDLLKQSDLPYHNILKVAHRKSKLGIGIDMLFRDLKMFLFSLRHHIDLLTGSTPEVAQVGWFLRRYNIVVGEDDAPVVPMFQKVAGPFVDMLLTPVSCFNDTMEHRSIKTESYNELAYLHPNHFTPDRRVVEKYFTTDTPYFILRFARLDAHHDNGIQGINTEIATRLIEILKPYGRIYITSERELESQFEPYRIQIQTKDMHHVMAFSSLYIGDSQTMAAEAGVLGVPFIRFNGFVGRIGYLNELENKYEMGYGIKPENVDDLYSKVTELLAMPDRKEIFQKRREKLLSEKIDYAAFLTWFIESYPESKKIMKSNADYQFRFR